MNYHKLHQHNPREIMKYQPILSTCWFRKNSHNNKLLQVLTAVDAAWSQIVLSQLADVTKEKMGMGCARKVPPPKKINSNPGQCCLSLLPHSLMCHWVSVKQADNDKIRFTTYILVVALYYFTFTKKILKKQKQPTYPNNPSVQEIWL